MAHVRKCSSHAQAPRASRVGQIGVDDFSAPRTGPSQHRSYAAPQHTMLKAVLPPSNHSFNHACHGPSSQEAAVMLQFMAAAAAQPLLHNLPDHPGATSERSAAFPLEAGTTRSPPAKRSYPEPPPIDCESASAASSPARSRCIRLAALCQHSGPAFHATQITSNLSPYTQQPTRTL